jgi:Asp/Glu/hydantoin racemase
MSPYTRPLSPRSIHSAGEGPERGVAGEGDPRIAYGGKTLYGAQVGILMLETRFPRIPGDMGNGETWPFPVLYKVVPGASPRRVVCNRAEGLLDEFLAAVRELVRLGADGITTTCGFLSLFQRELAAHVGVPVATSSLMQIPFVERILPPGQRVGVLTISANSLTEEHLRAAGADPATPVVGTDDGGEFTRAILNDEEWLDVAAAERDILAAGDALVANHSGIGAVLLECTNMVPYARALSQKLRLPVFSIYTFVTWFQAALAPRAFGWPATVAGDWRER